MIDREKPFVAVLLALIIYPRNNIGGAFQPEFMKPLANITIPLGRDAVFTCHVEHLGGYRVGWVKADTKAIQAIHDHVITHNPRVSVSHGDHSTWSLRIKGVQKEDEGLYMCQINTDPMKSQTGMLTIEVPPDFIPEETSGDVIVREGWHVQLKCRATGIPPPRVSWRREDQQEIIIRDSYHERPITSNEKVKVRKELEWIGEELHLTNIKREQMGVYHCIASNGVPPTISKRIIVDVHFKPMIHAPNQLVGAPLGTDVVLECFVEAYPQSINFWYNNNGAIIVSSGRHDVQVLKVTKGHSPTHNNFNYKTKMLLTIRNFTKQDVGTYKCTAKNSNGDIESSIRLYDITNTVKQKPLNEPDPGILEVSHDEVDESVDETAYSEFERMGEGRSLSLDNMIQSHVDSIHLSTSVSPRGKRPADQHLVNEASMLTICAIRVLTGALVTFCR